MKLPRWLDPRTNPAGWSALLGVAYAIWQGITAAQAQGPLTWKLVGHVAAGVLWAAVSAYVRSHVTPVADPRDGNGKPLGPPTMRQVFDAARSFGLVISGSTLDPPPGPPPPRPGGVWKWQPRPPGAPPSVPPMSSLPPTAAETADPTPPQPEGKP
jgi:hypothetical protein